MGVYNTVHFQCPRCDSDVEVQSKAEDGFSDWSSDKVPVVTAQAIEGETVWCKGCQRSFTIVRRPAPISTVSMALL